jgi:hypothetical protein
MLDLPGRLNPLSSQYDFLPFMIKGSSGLIKGDQFGFMASSQPWTGVVFCPRQSMGGLLANP